MKKFNRILLCSLCCIAFVSCHYTHGCGSRTNGVQVKASGTIIKRNLSVSMYKEIRVSSVINVFVVDMPKDVVKIEVDEAFDKYLKVEVSGDVLDIGMKESVRFANVDPVINVYVSNKDLEMIKASGASDITIKDRITAFNLIVSISGSSDINGPVKCTNLTIDACGASDVNMAVESDNLTLGVSGASDANMSAECKNIVVTVGGSSDVKLSGRSVNLVANSSGSADIDAYKLNADNVICEASGASDVKINVSKELKVIASGASDIMYKGEVQKIDANRSGASSVSRVK